jgi:hypothetical protein
MTDLELFLIWCKDKGHYSAILMIKNYRAMLESLKDDND